MELVTAPTDEISLPAAVDELYRGVGALADPRKELINGAVLAAPSLYETLLAEIPAKSGGDTFIRGVGRSLPNVWVDALDLRVEIDGRVRLWQPKGDSTPARLRALASRRWRPQDTRQVRDYAAEIQSWALSIRSLVEPTHVKSVSAPCPACGKRWVYRKHAGEDVRRPALQLVVDQGCTCQACKAFWEPSRYLFLCRLLGFELPACVLE